MIEMINSSFYEINTNYLLITSDQKRKIWTVKKMSFSRKYIAKMFSLKFFGK